MGKKTISWPLAQPPSPPITSRSTPNTSSINGKWQKLKSGKYFDTIDLANDRVKVCAITFSRLRSGEQVLRNAYPR